MRRIIAVSGGLLLCAVLAIAPVKRAEAYFCEMLETSHNGTQFFNGREGPVMLAERKLTRQAEAIMYGTGAMDYQIYPQGEWCSGWFMKYLLPHKHCRVRAVVCFH